MILCTLNSKSQLEGEVQLGDENRNLMEVQKKDTSVSYQRFESSQWIPDDGAHKTLHVFVQSSSHNSVCGAMP